MNQDLLDQAFYMENDPASVEDVGSTPGLVPASLTRYIVEARKKNDFVFYCEVGDIDLIYSPMTRRQYKIYETVEKMVGPVYSLFDVFGDCIFYPTRDMWEDEEFSSRQRAGIDDKIKQIIIESSLFHSIQAINLVKESIKKKFANGEIETTINWFIHKYLPSTILEKMDDLNCYELMERIAGIENLFQESKAQLEFQETAPKGSKRGG